MKNIEFTSSIWWIKVYRNLQFKHIVQLTLLTALSVFSIHCTRIEELLQKESPREIYLKAIQNSPIADTEIWQRWIAVGDSVLSRPVEVEPAFQQKIIYFPDQPDAWAWKINAMPGRQLEFKMVPKDTSHQLFTDVFTIDEEGIKLLNSTSDTIFIYEPEGEVSLILRIQPELLILGQATFSVKDYPVLGFPVEGGHEFDIGSFWGDPRDGGDRSHEGVDIFAARGTPVIAASDGRVHRTGNGGLGGKTVWMRSGGKSIYYAHLDSINVHSGQSVDDGDTIGFVGNTGNARTTPPHLHFGIYSRGAINPLPFISNPRNKISVSAVNLSPEARWGKIVKPRANVRPLPSTVEPAVASLTLNQIVGLKGVVNGWYEVLLPDSKPGFIHQSLVSKELTPIRDIRVNEGDSIFYPLTYETSFFIVDTQDDLVEYGSYGDRMLTRYKDHWVGAVHVRSD